MSKPIKRATANFRGIERNKSRVDSNIGFESDQNGRHRVAGEWQLRKGFARTSGWSNGGHAVLRMFEFVGQGNNVMTIAFLADGTIKASQPPTPLWTS